MPSILAVTSSRGAGATSLAIGLAAALSRRGRTLLVDLNPDEPDVAPLLDVDDGQNVYHLAHRAQLELPTPSGLEQEVRWHQGLAVLPGITEPGQGALLTEKFVIGLLRAAVAAFPHVVLDMGRVRPELPGMAMANALLWVMKPTPVGLVYFDRTFEQMAAARVPWLGALRVVVNQTAPHSVVGVGHFLNNEHRVRSVGTVPYEPDLWTTIELGGALRELRAQSVDEGRSRRRMSKPAVRTMNALEAVLRRLSNEPKAMMPVPSEA